LNRVTFALLQKVTFFIFMNWIPLTNEAQLQDITARSFTKPQVILKYSSRCSISGLVKSRLEKNYQPVEIDFYFLDLFAYRSVSGKVAEMFNIPHESPQLLLIKNGECVYEESHLGINMQETIAQSLAA
jgi:bacillithiol system protein YtxJ